MKNNNYISYKDIKEAVIKHLEFIKSQILATDIIFDKEMINSDYTTIINVQGIDILLMMKKI